MLTTDRLKELEDKKKALLAQIDAEIEQVKSLAKAGEEFSALVAKYKFANATEFLRALNLIPAAFTPTAKPARKASASPSGDSLKKGPFSAVEKAQIVKLHEDGLKPAEIAAKMKRKEGAIVNILNDTK